ncbi:hypothetical protein OEZ85_013781 [Tetradesmus obliquus]|uniref:Cyclic nucleotide-binding domain-containing protein n=2 Tax=Tetradesmus obliquus TaxID=3088 RepID=A0ABY8UB01_TETOB|nr:hypothetical protein OEZ85_013781 [Tetradesmus obliquus]
MAGGGGGAGGLGRPSSGRSLASRSVGMAGAYSSSLGAAAAAVGSGSNDVTNVSNEIRSGGAEPGSVLDVFSKALGRVSRISASMGLPGAAARAGSSRAGGPEGDSSDWDDAASSMYKASHGLGKNSSYGTGSVQGVGGVSEEELADARSWLLSGLKRYFYGKRMDGLLSAAGLRILDSACEVALEDPTKPLRLWGSLSRDAANNLLLRVLTMCLFACRRGAVGLHTIGAAGRWLSYPLRVLARMLQRPLNQVLLSSVEVAMEYLMGLTTSPYVEWLQEGEVWAVLISEIQVETAAVARFLVDREIEAPERYSAVQSYRVAMAVLRQQRLFVESLFESGMLDSAEQSQLAHPIEAAERRLELLGPCWKAPSLGEVLRQLPFMRGQSQGVIDFFIKYGHLLQLGKGSRLPEDKQLYIVQSGIVKVSYTPDLGSHQEYFLGAGGVFNLYSALTGEELPGTTDAVAQGNALGKGPVLFCFSAKGLRQLSAAAAAGDASYQQLELDMHRLGGLFLLERLQPQVELETSQALARLAPLHVRGDGRPGGARHKRASRQQRAAWVRGHLAALRGHLKQQLVKSELLVLPAGCAAAQESHVMLLQGSIQVKVADGMTVSDPAAAEVARWMVSAGRHTHQSILPWLWEVLSEDDLAHAPAGLPREPLPVTITAGPEGAVILVCPSAAEEAAMAAGTVAAAITAAGNTNNLMRMPKAAAVMEPLPGSRGSATAGTGALPSALSVPSAAPASNPLPNLSRNSPTTRNLARTSPIPIRRVSPLPLAGADIDNRAAVGISSSGGSAAAAAAGGLGSLAMITSDGEEQQQQEGAAGAVAEQQQQQQQQPAAAVAKPAPRRTRSVKPLRAGGGKDAANLR